MSATAPIINTPDYDAIKSKQNTAWGSGDYAVVGTTLQIVGEALCEALDLRPGQSLLDVAAGNGNLTLAAARRWAEVTSTDYVESLLLRGKERAAAEHLEATFKVADAENLPFPDASFDVVGSTFGVMFTPDQARAAVEMLRVCRSGGRIGLANWTPESFIGGVFKTIGRHLPPPAGVSSPALWGTREHLDRLFGDSATGIHVTEKTFAFRYRSPEHFLEIFRTYYGPVLKAYEALDADGRTSLTNSLLELIAIHNAATDGTMVVPAEYLEVVIDRR